MSNNLTIYNYFATVPEEAKKPIKAGRLSGMTDINPMWRIKMLTEQFGAVGFGWYYKIVEEKLVEASNDEVLAFVKIELYVKVDGEWSMPIEGVGGNKLTVKESKGLYNNDECFKMALTDALSIACKSLGMGASVYYAKDRTKYDLPESKPPVPKENFKKLLGDLLIEIFGKDNAQDELERITTWTNQDGKVIKGKRDLKALSDKEAQVGYGKLKKLKEEKEKK